MISQSSTYAIRALSQMNSPEGSYKLVRDIAEVTNIPASFLAKIIGSLHKHGLVTARRGSKGGVKTQVPAHEITVLKVCQALRDPVLRTGCLLGFKECRTLEPCPCHGYEDLLKNDLMKYLDRITVLDIGQVFQLNRVTTPIDTMLGDSNAS